MNILDTTFEGIGIVISTLVAIILICAIVKIVYCRMKWLYKDNKEKKRIKVFQFKYCFMSSVEDVKHCVGYKRIIFNTRNEMETFIKAKNVNEAVVEFFKTKPFDTLIRKVKEVG